MSNRPARRDLRAAYDLRAVVVANGPLPDLTPFHALLARAHLVVAADGGARLLLEQDQPLDAVVGDMDSLPPHLLARWQARGGETIRVSAVKDETDLELAVRYAQEHGARRIVALGALGGRADHALANALLLALPSLRDVDAAIVDECTRIIAVHDRADLAGQPGDLLSLLPLTTRVTGVVTQGLHYPLRGETLYLGVPRGVSNVLTGQRASVRLDTGVLLAVHTWSGRRPLEWPE